MSAKVVISSLVGSLVASYVVYDVISHKMIFGAKRPRVEGIYSDEDAQELHLVPTTLVCVDTSTSTNVYHC